MKTQIKDSVFPMAFALVLISGLLGGCAPSNVPLSTRISSPTGSNTAPGASAPSSKVQLAWNSVAGQQNGFFIEESTDGNNFSQVLTVPDRTNSATISVPSAGTYFFRIRSFNNAGASPFSPTITAKAA